MSVIVNHPVVGESVYIRIYAATPVEIDIDDDDEPTRYVASDAAILATGLPAQDDPYDFTAFLGTVATSDPSTDLAIWAGKFLWDGAVVVEGVRLDLERSIAGTFATDQLGEVLQAMRALAIGKFVVNTATNTLTLYKSDGTTPLKVSDLTPTAVLPTTRTPQ